MKYKTTILALAAAAFLPGTATAALIVNIEEVGSDVVASYSGSIDLTGIGFNILGSANTNRIWATGGQANFQNGVAKKASLTDFGQNPWTVAPSAFGTGGAINADSLSIAGGNAFGFQSSGFFIESSYVSGTPLSGSMTFNGQTLASMGINVGTGIMNATFSSGDTLTVNAIAGAAAVPEPGQVAASLLLLAGLGGYVALQRRKKQPAQAA